MNFRFDFSLCFDPKWKHSATNPKNNIKFQFHFWLCVVAERGSHIFHSLISMFFKTFKVEYDLRIQGVFFVCRITDQIFPNPDLILHMLMQDILFFLEMKKYRVFLVLWHVEILAIFKKQPVVQ